MLFDCVCALCKVCMCVHHTERTRGENLRSNFFNFVTIVFSVMSSLHTDKYSDREEGCSVARFCDKYMK